MYYQKAIQLQAFFEMAEKTGKFSFFFMSLFTFCVICVDLDMRSLGQIDIRRGHMEVLQLASDEKKQAQLCANIEAVTDMKFTYVVTCQNFGSHRRTGNPRANDILRLMEK